MKILQYQVIITCPEILRNGTPVICMLILLMNLLLYDESLSSYNGELAYSDPASVKTTHKDMGSIWNKALSLWQ